MSRRSHISVCLLSRDSAEAVEAEDKGGSVVLSQFLEVAVGLAAVGSSNPELNWKLQLGDMVTLVAVTPQATSGSEALMSHASAAVSPKWGAEVARVSTVS